MKDVFFIIGLYLLMILGQGSQLVSSAGLGNLTNVFDLTAISYQQQINKRHLFVLFYETRLVLHLYNISTQSNHPQIILTR